MVEVNVGLSGVGLVSSFGDGVALFLENLVAGKSTVATGSRFDTASFRGKLCSELPEADRRSKSALMDTAFREALLAANLEELPDGSLVIVVGQYTALATGQASRRTFSTPALDMLLENQVFLSQACASAAVGIALATHWIRAGNGPFALIIGATLLNKYEYASLDSVRALSNRGCNPFDLHRDGTVIGEGAGAIILEEVEHARQRDLYLHRRVDGVHNLIGAESNTTLNPEEALACMSNAMKDAKRTTVGYVHAHATGTKQGDAAELKAIEDLALKNSMVQLPVSSHKGAIGHTLHSSGFFGIATAAHFLDTGIVAPNVGLTETEPTYRVLLPLNSIVSSGPRVALVNSFGFGGNLASVVLSRCNVE